VQILFVAKLTETMSNQLKSKYSLPSNLPRAILSCPWKLLQFLGIFRTYKVDWLQSYRGYFEGLTYPPKVSSSIIILILLNFLLGIIDVVIEFPLKYYFYVRELFQKYVTCNIV
jgi:hypothetical protein